MAQWTETSEPYIKVYETVHTTTTNPTAGEDLIIGVTLISDAGPATPTLISSQSEFLSTYASGDLTEDYIESLNELYDDSNNTGDTSVAATMFMNAYRLAGTCTMLVVRAAKANDIYYGKPLDKTDLITSYILRDGALMKGFTDNTNGVMKIVLDIDKDDANHDQDGWSIAITDVGILGNRTTDDGTQYDYYVGNLPDLVEQLNETSKFFSPSYKFFSDAAGTIETDDEDEAVSVIFYEVYLGQNVLDTTDSRCPEGTQYVIICEPDWTLDNPDQSLIDINAGAWSGFDEARYYAINQYNSNTDLRVRIRRFNHDAVVSKTLSSPTCSETSESPWTVLTSVLDTFTKNGQQEPSESVLERDFFEICILDPNVSDEAEFINVGNVTGRGDMAADEVNDYLSMIQLNLPTDLHDLGLNYYDYTADNTVWVELESGDENISSWKKQVDSLTALYAETGMSEGDVYRVGTAEPYTYYQYTENGEEQIFCRLGIDPTESSLLDVSESDLMSALDEITEQEVYTVEGLCDLGNTSLSLQTYMANMAVNDNYFYPISTVNSTSYLTVANNASKISTDSWKLYFCAPWDTDTGTLGWRFYASPAVLYWEAVGRNRNNNSEFAPVMGQSNGVINYQSPVVEWNKKTRQLLLSKKVNTAKWNISTQAWEMNDNYTKTTTLADSIMADESNARLAIRISKAMPTLLRQYIGWKISQKLWESATSTLDYWFKNTILAMQYTIEAYQIVIDETNNPVEIQRQNKMVVSIYVRYMRTLKYILVYHEILDVGVDFGSIDNTSSALLS